MDIVKEEQLQEQGDQNPLTAFIYGLKSPESKRQYPRRFKVFLDFLNIDGNLEEQSKTFLYKSNKNIRWTEDSLMKFIEHQKQRAYKGEIAESTISNYYKATKLFCEMNDLVLNWKKIARGLPKARTAANDRAPTIEEIQKLVEYPDRRIKPIIFTMVSSGIRLGAWDFLKWKHVTPIKDKDDVKVISAKMVVYAGDREEYYTFITPEAYNSLKEWIDFRKSYGENITGEPWLMRDIWQTTNIDYGAKHGLATYPRKLKSSGIKRLIERALWEQGVRQPLLKGVKRHEWKAAHGFRKFYKTMTEQVMRSINVEVTMGHDIGVSASYYKPKEDVILQDYLKAVDLLTVNSDNRLKIEVKELQEIKERDLARDDVITNLSDQVMNLIAEVEKLKSGDYPSV